MQCGEVEQLVRDTLQVELEALQHVLGSVDSSYRSAVELILALSGKVVVTGVGKSGLIGQKIAATLASTGTLAIFMHPAEAMHGDLGQVSRNDVVVALSKSGESEEVNNLLPALRRIGARLVAITANPGSTLACAADVVLYAGVQKEACPFDLAPTASTTVALAIGDALAMALMKLKGFQPEDFALYHPGGRLGRRLLLEVKDVMLPAGECAVLTSDPSMEDVLFALTRYGQGIVLFTKLDGALEGILTDGDVRRLLGLHRERIFDIAPEDVMNRSPLTVGSDMRAAEALEFMERRPRPLNVVPVVANDGTLLGICRLHELLRVT